MKTQVHVIPINDSQAHMVNIGCPCYPLQNEHGTWVHNAFDTRESYERQGLLKGLEGKGWAIYKLTDK